MSKRKTVDYVVCPCGKRGFEDEYDADKAMGRARAKRERLADRNGTRRGMKRENRMYYCDLGDLYHLTEMSRRDVSPMALIPSQRMSMDSLVAA